MSYRTAAAATRGQPHCLMTAPRHRSGSPGLAAYAAGLERDTELLVGVIATLVSEYDDLLARAASGEVITICYGCAGSRTEPDGRTPCRRCGGSGVDPNP